MYYVDEHIKNTNRVFPQQGRYEYLRYDMTENKLYSLSQETEDLCASLTQDVTFYYLGRTGQEDATVTEGKKWG